MSVARAESSAAMDLDPKAFAAWHRWDRNFFLSYIGFFWLAVLLGFIPDAIAHERLHKPAYPIAIHVHAAVMVCWLSLLTAQILLIRNRRAATHRRLGLVGIGLALAVVVIGPIAAIASDRSRMALPTYHAEVLSVQLEGIVSFAGATAAGLLLRGKAAAHERLILVGTIGLLDAAFFRWWGPTMVQLFGAAGFWPFMARYSLGSAVLVLGLCLYDLITRRRIHPATLAGAAWILGCTLVSDTVYHSTWWAPAAVAIIGR
jgi:FtsH-binding integral membrane protein